MIKLDRGRCKHHGFENFMTGTNTDAVSRIVPDYITYGEYLPNDSRQLLT